MSSSVVATCARVNQLSSISTFRDCALVRAPARYRNPPQSQGRIGCRPALSIEKTTRICVPRRIQLPAQIEDAPRPQFALLELGQRDQVAMGRDRDDALHDRGIAAAQQHRLAAREPGGVGAADAERRQRPQPGVDRLQQRGERRKCDRRR